MAIPGYLAFGINEQGKGMVGGDAVVGFFDGAKKQPEVYSYRLVQYTDSRNAERNPEYTFDNATFWTNGSVVILVFRRPFNTAQHNLTRNKYFSVFASIGNPPSDDGVLSYHFQTADKMDVDFSSGLSINFDFRVLHGTLMAIAWGLILPIGILAARYLKSIKSDDQPPLWFSIHRATQPLGFFVSIAGFISILYHVFSNNATHFNSLHPILGFILVILSLPQFVWGALRPHLNKSGAQTNARIIWQLLHRNLGKLMILFGFFIIPLGLCKYQTGTNDLFPKECFIRPDNSPTTVQPFLILHFSWVFVILMFVLITEIVRCKQSSYVELN
jgi:hypothetical protein